MEGAHKAAVLAVAQVGEEDGVHGETACGRLNAVRRRLLASAGMDGSVVLYDCFNGKHVQTLRHHNKFVVRVAFDASGRYLASAGYDRRINIYLREEEEDPKDLAVSYELVHTIETASNPEAILFVQSGEVTDSQNNAVQLDLRDWLVYTIRGDCFLHYVALPTHRQVESSNEERVIADWEELRYNTNPSRDDYHVSYSLLDLALHPSGMYLSAQTGDHAFSSSLSQSGITSSFAASPTSLSRLLLMPVHSDVRAATLWTAAPYSPYVSPRHAWMPSGRGACVNGEDGSVRLVDLQGKVRAVIYAHGQPASSAGDGLRSSVEWSRGGRGNTIVKDVVALDECTIASCGFDRTVRVCTLAS
ncbi:hypothetical protein K437DRAFT_238797 [Tilletiaria anomala UBC 951]|uniref:Uncharacterized protein n=1 Tax=Tilletiaria anomala (strain ATCC 24038 / CBS 436.72 / UBC 951) TaxID=1037660 RepID=A0A066VFU9_TILAU|nr:uncharacterized protein K437DRAFT_238797 [Tilletiaria anomala UBC 951]KDN40617.1 hypothetical protein K437DRAFT_238797 [Tilletiaria anomala UBC 951]